MGGEARMRGESVAMKASFGEVLRLRSRRLSSARPSDNKLWRRPLPHDQTVTFLLGRLRPLCVQMTLLASDKAIKVFFSPSAGRWIKLLLFHSHPKVEIFRRFALKM